jgi:aminopeptidase N
LPASFLSFHHQFQLFTLILHWLLSNYSFVAQVYSLIGGFCVSAVNFHAKDGSGYKFLADVVLQLDKLNPQVGPAFHVNYLRFPLVNHSNESNFSSEDYS